MIRLWLRYLRCWLSGHLSDPYSSEPMTWPALCARCGRRVPA